MRAKATTVDEAGGRRDEDPDRGVRAAGAGREAGPIRRVDLGEAASLGEGEARATIVDGRPIAVWRVDGALRAYSGACLHRGGPLAEGYVRDGIVTCPLHWWRYDLRTGTLLDAAGTRLAAYPVAEVGGRIVVEVPAAEDRPAEATSIRLWLLRRAREGSLEGGAGDPAGRSERSGRSSGSSPEPVRARAGELPEDGSQEREVGA